RVLADDLGDLLTWGSLRMRDEPQAILMQIGPHWPVCRRQQGDFGICGSSRGLATRYMDTGHRLGRQCMQDLARRLQASATWRPWIAGIPPSYCRVQVWLRADT